MEVNLMAKKKKVCPNCGESPMWMLIDKLYF